jgi:hypothetical protein
MSSSTARNVSDWAAGGGVSITRRRHIAHFLGVYTPTATRRKHCADALADDTGAQHLSRVRPPCLVLGQARTGRHVHRPFNLDAADRYGCDITGTDGNIGVLFPFNLAASGLKPRKHCIGLQSRATLNHMVITRRKRGVHPFGLRDQHERHRLIGFLHPKQAGCRNRLRHLPHTVNRNHHIVAHLLVSMSFAIN